MLYDLFLEFGIFSGHLDASSYLLIAFFHDLYEKACPIERALDEKQEIQNRRPRPVCDINAEKTDYEIIDEMRGAADCHGKYYGRRRRVRAMQKYTVDGTKEPSVCTDGNYFDKKGKKPRAFTGGIMAFWCEHGICLGFHMMSGAGESLDDVMLRLIGKQQRLDSKAENELCLQYLEEDITALENMQLSSDDSDSDSADE